MVIDAAKGIEAQTRKLFEVCRLRDVPIITFINKLDREGRDPFDLIDEIEQTLALDVDPGQLADRHGAAISSAPTTCSRESLLLFERGADDRGRRDRRSAAEGLDDPKLAAAAARRAPSRRCASRSRWRAACARRSTSSRSAQGHLTPVFFGSALNNFGVRELLRGVAELAPPPRPQPARPTGRAGRAGRGDGHRLRLQGPGQHGPEAPRPHRLRAAVLRPLPAAA